jgi:hypothetical protein
LNIVLRTVRLAVIAFSQLIQILSLDVQVIVYRAVRDPLIRSVAQLEICARIWHIRIAFRAVHVPGGIISRPIDLHTVRT